MDFLYANHKDLAKVSRLLVRGLFSEILKIHRLVWIFIWIFGYFKSVSSMFRSKLNLTKAVLSKTSTFGRIFVSWDGVLCAMEIHGLCPMDLKIYTPAKTPRL
jgi:hypothetical protein